MGKSSAGITTFLFWNINRKPLLDLVGVLAAEHQVDVLILAECKLPAGLLLKSLNRASPGFRFPMSLCESIKIFTRFSRQFLRPKYESDRVSIRRLALPAQTEILLAAVHFPSKLHWSDASQAQECGPLARAISKEEQAVGHRRTLLVGDLNMNPFEEGVVGAAGLNGVMTRRLAKRQTRTVQAQEYPFFSTIRCGATSGTGRSGRPAPITMSEANTCFTSGTSLIRFCCGPT